jgi:hypothetical protein
MIALHILGLAVCLLGGMTVHRALARRWFGALQDIPERELLLHGLLASLIANGTLGTYLALLRLFHPFAFVIVFTAALGWLREDTRATVHEARRAAGELLADLCRLRLVPISATAGFVALGVMLTLLARVPTDNVDAWAFHLPLAFSMVEHHGFIHPQIGHPFYSHQPLFINVLFAQAVSVKPHFFAATLVNIFIYLFTLLSLAAVWRQRAFAFCLLLAVVASNTFFTLGVAVPVTDVPRSCFSVLGLTFAALYIGRRIAYYAGLAALCIGAAIASKFTELVSLMLFGLLLLPGLRAPQGRRLALQCALMVTGVASYWYLKNLVLLGNPLYPFLFGHPGLSDAWMADYMREMTTAFDPAQRHLSHSLLRYDGWRDLLGMSWAASLPNRPLAVVALLFGIGGSWAAPRRIGPMLAVSLLLFVFWYAVMFNHIRWAVPAYLMLHVTGCYGLLTLLEKSAPARQWLERSQSLFASTGLNAAVLAAGSACLAGLWALPPSSRISQSLHARLQPVAEPVSASLNGGGLEAYLARTRKGYALYREVAQRGLHGVFQPLDSGVKLYATAYNGGLPGDWFIDITQVPAGLTDAKSYVAEHRINYFITRDDLEGAELERLGAARLASAARVMEALKPGAQLVMQDAYGWKLYRVAPAAGQP